MNLASAVGHAVAWPIKMNENKSSFLGIHYLVGEKEMQTIIAKSAKIHLDAMCYREVTHLILNVLECLYRFIAYKLFLKSYYIFTTTVKEVPCEK